MFKLLNTTAKQLTKHSRTTNVMLQYRYVIGGFVSYMFVLPVVILFKLVRCSTYYRSYLFYRITWCFIWFYVMLHYLLYIFTFFIHLVWVVLSYFMLNILVSYHFII